MLLEHIRRAFAHQRLTFILLLCVFGIAACTVPVQDNAPTRDLGQVTSSSELLTQAQSAEKLTSPQKDQTLLAISEQLIAIGAANHATTILQKVDITALNASEKARYAISITDAYLSARPTALTSFAIPRLTDKTLLDAINDASTEQQVYFYRNSAELYKAVSDAKSSIEQHMILDTLLIENEVRQSNSDQLWHYLSSLDSSTLQQLKSATASIDNSTTYSGWIELAITQKNASQNLNSQYQSLRAWQQRHTQHPANIYLPSDLRALQNLVAEQPQHIALLLPLEGRLAKAGMSIRDGFFAAYYRQQNTTQSTPKVTLYNTSNGNIDAIYEQANSNGADLIIGPLSKENVETLFLNTNTSTPILALNYVDPTPMADTDLKVIQSSDTVGSTTPDSKVSSDQAINQNENKTTDTQPPSTRYQFGLSLEDEATQVAEKAWQDGHRRALVISATADWSERAATAFIRHWQTLGGAIAESTTLEEAESYSDTIQQALHIDQSKARASALKRLFGRTFDFEPRRRRDIDMVFLVTRTREGTQIKPILNFFYAGDLPVYATSQLYTSSNSKRQNIDLNNIQLTIMPWITQTNNAEKIALEQTTGMTPGYEKLYALGADSFLLHSRLPQLRRSPNQSLYGATGQLSMSSDGRISRQQEWAYIKDGELVPVSTSTSNTD